MIWFPISIIINIHLVTSANILTNWYTKLSKIVYIETRSATEFIAYIVSNKCNKNILNVNHTLLLKLEMIIAIEQNYLNRNSRYESLA